MSDLLGMSDEDFLKLNAPGPAPASGEPNPGSAVEEADESQTGSTAQDANETTGNDGAQSGDDDDAGNDDAADADGDDENGGSDDSAGSAGSDAADGEDGDQGGAEKPADGAEGSAAAPGSETGKDGAKPVDPDADAKNPKDGADAGKPAGTEGGAEPAVIQPKPEELQAFYAEVMKPFKANGKTVTPRSPEDVIRLMQMGAGFGRKLQDIQPHVKTLRMLEKENLLDPNELSYLIDLRNKNPEAIKKLIKDSNIDPLDLNIGDNVDYTPVNRSVSDAEVAFEDALSALKERTNGSETIQIINQTWDKESLALIWEQPALLDVFQTQRENGVYDKIVAEIEHQKTFGLIPHNTPFVQAYTIAGDALVKSGGLPGAPSDQPAPVTETPKPAVQPRVLATRTQPPKPAVAHNDKANAAAPTQSSTRKAAAVINPLSMSDDEFLKRFEGRL